MRVLLMVLVLVLVVGFLTFMAWNIDTTVPVQIGQTLYQAVPLHFIVLSALAAMVVLVGIAAIVEGAGIRLENRRLRREIHKLETEINYLRTQPPSLPRSEPDEPEASPDLTFDDEEDDRPSAPVYGRGDEEWSPEPDDDDDVYSGGRAV